MTGRPALLSWDTFLWVHARSPGCSSGFAHPTKLPRCFARSSAPTSARPRAAQLVHVPVRVPVRVLVLCLCCACAVRQ